MNFGLVGWGIASGNGGMNSDIALLAPWVTHWLVPEHSKSQNHAPYIDRQVATIVMHCKRSGDERIYNKFLAAVDGIIYVEHPCLIEPYDIVSEAKKQGKLVVGIPMWEWWPERKPWAMKTDILWAVTEFTNRYLKSLSDVLFVHGYEHSWRNKVIGNKWGVNIEDFPFKQRDKAESFVFINGNGGYKLRKASDIVFEAFSKPGAPPLTVYTQSTNLSENLSSNITVIDKNFPERKDVYSEGDIFIFTSYWEGLCHGIYEGQAVGGVVITTDHPPMNECGTPYLVPVNRFSQEDLSGKKIIKAHPSADFLYNLVSGLYKQPILNESLTGYRRMVETRDLSITLTILYAEIIRHSNC